MHPYTEYLLDASFKGVPFYVDSERQNQGGRRIVIHPIPNCEYQYIEDLGPIPWSFSIDAYVIGEQILLTGEEFQSASLPENFSANNENYVPGEVLIKFKENPQLDEGHFFVSSSINSINSLNEKFKPKKFKKIKLKNKHVYKLSFDDSQNLDEIIKAYSDNPNVEFAQPNYIYEPDLVPNDPLWA